MVPLELIFILAAIFMYSLAVPADADIFEALLETLR